jgi:dienelactone hydrolase
MATARTVLDISSYRPILAVPKLKAPILFVAAAIDNLCPAKEIEEAASLAPKGELITMQCNHFQIYAGDYFEEATDAQVRFIEKATGWSAQPAVQES